MRKIKGFALLQALFFMMFIMAAASIVMMMSFQRNVSATGQRLAIDAYPALESFMSSISKDTATSLSPSEYFAQYPISTKYCQQLVTDGFIADNSQCVGTAENPAAWSANLTLTITKP